jgi:hypothetical protein
VNLLEIKTDAASYLGVTVADLTQNSQDLWLSAANRARRNAEQLYNFEFSRALVELEVDGVTGGSLDDATYYGDDDSALVKSIIEVGLFDENGNLRPIDWTTVAASLEWQRMQKPGFLPRYPTDGQAIAGLCGSQRVTFANRNVYLVPKQADFTLTLGLEVYTFAADWAAADLDPTPVEDTWTTQGAEYLLWATVCSLNVHFQQFVPRTEGNLPPPTDLRDAGLQTLLNWDIMSFEQFRRHNS